MALLVQKFGGTSVGSIERMQEVAKIIYNTRMQGHDVVVVVSAMHGETDRLIGLANATSTPPNPRECDALIATGEQVSSALLSMCLIGLNCPARSFSAHQIKICTNSQHRKATIVDVNTNVLEAELKAGRIPVVAGFQGVDAGGHITTIGRGGSDITAVALAAALKASECQIYTDVDGVYTTDPRVVHDARRLNQITFEEMLELASLGAKVLQNRAVEFAHQFQVPVRVLSSFTQGPGTLITTEPRKVEDTSPIVSGIAFDRNQAKLTVMGIPKSSDLSSQLLSKLSQSAIEVDMIIQNVASSTNCIDLSFTVPLDDYSAAIRLTEAAAKNVKGTNVQGNERIAKLSVVGVGMKSHAGAASMMMQALSDEGIEIHLITSSEVKISTVIDEKYMELGARTLHTIFGLGKEK